MLPTMPSMLARYKTQNSKLKQIVLCYPQHPPPTQRTPMTDADDITSLQELLAAQRRTLAVYRHQLANLGADHAPPGVHNGIVDARAEIARLKAALRDLGAAVEDQAGDVVASNLSADHAQQL